MFIDDLYTCIQSLTRIHINVHRHTHARAVYSHADRDIHALKAHAMQTHICTRSSGTGVRIRTRAFTHTNTEDNISCCILCTFFFYILLISIRSI